MPTNSVTAYFINGLADESLEIRRFMVGLKSIFLSVSKILSKYDNWFSIPAIKGLVTLILVAGYLLPPTPSLSSNLKLEIEHLLKYDHRIKEQEKIVNVSDLNFTATRLTKFPTLSLTSNLTREKLTNNAAEATLLNARDVDATLTFPVIDKSLDESVNTAELSAELSSISKDTVVNGILLEAVSAYINLISSEKFLDYSIKSVENIKEL